MKQKEKKQEQESKNYIRFTGQKGGSREDEDGKMYCTAYEVWHDEAGYAYTKTDEHRRLW